MREEIEYSDKEKQLIEFFGFSDIINNVQPPVLYRMMAEYAFIHDLSGPYVDSLRRCIMALNHALVYRMTTTWDEMIHD
jgi:hypothetical protein